MTNCKLRNFERHRNDAATFEVLQIFRFENVILWFKNHPKLQVQPKHYNVINLKVCLNQHDH